MNRSLPDIQVQYNLRYVPTYIVIYIVYLQASKMKNIGTFYLIKTQNRALSFVEQTGCY